MTTRVRLIRRYPVDERRKPKAERKRWVWVLRWRESGGSMPGESIGSYAEARDTWRPSQGEQERLTVKEAERARQSKHVELSAGTAKPRPAPGAMQPWPDFIASYLAETKGTMRDSSLRCVREAFDRFHEVVQPKYPADVNATMVKRFVQALRDKGRADATIKKHLAALKRVWNDPTTELAGAAMDAFHSVRKSCITNWLSDGVPPHEVQAMAGHASLETTMKYYSKVDIDAMTRVRQASERFTAGIIARR